MTALESAVVVLCLVGLALFIRRKYRQWKSRKEIKAYLERQRQFKLRRGMKC